MHAAASAAMLCPRIKPLPQRAQRCQRLQTPSPYQVYVLFVRRIKRNII